MDKRLADLLGYAVVDAGQHYGHVVVVVLNRLPPRVRRRLPRWAVTDPCVHRHPTLGHVLPYVAADCARDLLAAAWEKANPA